MFQSIDLQADASEDVDARMILETFIQSLSPRQRRYLEYRFQGFNNRESSEKVGFTGSAGSQNLDKIFEAAKNFLSQ